MRAKRPLNCCLMKIKRTSYKKMYLMPNDAIKPDFESKKASFFRKREL